VTNRVVMGPLPGGGSGLRVSRPGNDVLDTNLTGKQLAFDSRWPTTARVHMAGTVNPASSGTQTVGFGTTFANIPPAFVWSKHPTTGVWSPLVVNYPYAFQDVFTPGNTGPLQIFSDRIAFFGAAGQSYRYLVLRPL